MRCQVRLFPATACVMLVTHVNKLSIVKTCLHGKCSTCFPILPSCWRPLQLDPASIFLKQRVHYITMSSGVTTSLDNNFSRDLYLLVLELHQVDVNQSLMKRVVLKNTKGK